MRYDRATALFIEGEIHTVYTNFGKFIKTKIKRTVVFNGNKQIRIYTTDKLYSKGEIMNKLRETGIVCESEWC